MSASTLTPAIIQELLEKHREVLLSSLVKMLPAASASASSSDVATPAKGGRKKKEKKPVDPNAPPKEKRAPNSWILFSMRVEKLVRAAEEAAGKTTKEERMHTIVIKQFAASLKTTKPYDDWADDEITEALTTWTPPEVSKMAAAKAEKASASAPSSDAASVASADDAPAAAAADAPTPAAKPKRQMSDEAKASMAAKRAATLAAKKALGAAAPAEAAPDASADSAPADAAAPAVAVAPVVKKAVTVKPKKAAAPPPPPTDKKVDLSFYSWTHDGKDFYTNDRGDVVTTDFEWVGRFDGKSIDENAAEPADLAEATLRE